MQIHINQSIYLNHWLHVESNLNQTSVLTTSSPLNIDSLNYLILFHAFL